MKLPPDQRVACRGCGRGEHRDTKTNQCEYCAPGFYQGENNHKGNLGIIRTCKQCQAGGYAKRVMEFREFEESPRELLAICSETNDLGQAENCNIVQGFHVDANGELDSGVGLPIGQKLQLKTVLRIDDPAGGKMVLRYKLLNADPNEKFRVSVDGLTVHIGSQSSEEYQTFEYPMLGDAEHVVDIALLSDFQERRPGFKSRARVLLQSAVFEGTQLGGGVECRTCPKGYISNANRSGCERCPPGKTANAAQTTCDLCPPGHIK